MEGAKKLVVVSAMGSHPSSPVKVTDIILTMIDKAARKDDGFLLDLAALQEKHIVTAKTLLGSDSRRLNAFIAGLMEDIANLKSMCQAISIGEWEVRRGSRGSERVSGRGASTHPQRALSVRSRAQHRPLCVAAPAAHSSRPMHIVTPRPLQRAWPRTLSQTTWWATGSFGVRASSPRRFA